MHHSTSTRKRIFAAVLLAALLLPAFAIGPISRTPVYAESCPAWEVVPAPGAPGSGNVLLSVSGTSASDVWAVGYSGLEGSTSTLIEHWNGQSWSVVPSPNPGPSNNRLTSVVAIAPNVAWAVGSFGPYQSPQTLALMWDGTRWVHVGALDPDRAGNYFAAVDASGPTDVWAVGGSGNRYQPRTLVERWDGSSWKKVDSLDEGRADRFNGVSARAANDVWVVGDSGSPDQYGRVTIKPVLNHWDGAEWSKVTGQIPGAIQSSYNAIVALDPAEVWAAGWSYEGGSTYATLTGHWDGRAWSLVTSPNGAPMENELLGVAGAAPNDVWAVGYSATQKNGPSSTLALHWDGAQWAQVPSANPAPNSTLNGVAAFPGGAVWAVGASGPSEWRETLVMRYADKCAAPPTAPPAPTAPPTSTPVPVAVVPIPGSNSRTFPETGKSVGGLFLDYWTANGGLAQQGYPISDVVGELSDLNGKPYTVQYFERAVFEYHPENQAPYNVLLSQLGTFQYKKKYPNGAPGQIPNRTDGQLFSQTGHWVGGKFWKYWQANGGLAQQGYPISDEFTEISDLNGKPYTVQYFERAVFELHPENQAPYDVLLSQLGTFRYNEKHGRW